MTQKSNHHCRIPWAKLTQNPEKDWLIHGEILNATFSDFILSIVITGLFQILHLNWQLKKNKPINVRLSKHEICVNLQITDFHIDLMPESRQRKNCSEPNPVVMKVNAACVTLWPHQQVRGSQFKRQEQIETREMKRSRVIHVPTTVAKTAP